MRHLSLCVCAAFAAACHRGDSESRVTQAAAASGTAATRAPAAAEAVVGDFLRRALVANSVAAQPDSLFACERYGSGIPELAPAKYQLVGSEMHGDTAIVRVAIVSVAEVRQRLHGYEVTQRIRQDTLSWSLIRGPGSSRWGICGFSREGPDLVRIQYVDSRARWLGGASLASVEALADSVARAH